MGPNDIVIHYRNGTGESPSHVAAKFWDTTVPGLAYFTHIIDLHFKETGPSTIYFVTDPRFRQNHHVVDGLKAKYPQRLLISRGNPEEDLLLGHHAPILIACTETFSWMMAYITSARKIYLVYESGLARGARGMPLHNMFIHDDPRVLYYDVLNTEIILQTADQVLDGNTTFAKSLQRRVNPCSGWI